MLSHAIGVRRASEPDAKKGATAQQLPPLPTPEQDAHDEFLRKLTLQEAKQYRKWLQEIMKLREEVRLRPPPPQPE